MDGQEAAQAPRGPQIQRREAWVDLPAEYQGFKVRIWVNAPTKYWNDVTGDDEVLRLDALKRIVLEHNSWLDFDGEPYPPSSDVDFWEEIPTELAVCVIAAVQAEMQRLPNSMIATPRRSRRG